jgi:hypothetical protein
MLLLINATVPRSSHSPTNIQTMEMVAAAGSGVEIKFLVGASMIPVGPLS